MSDSNTPSARLTLLQDIDSTWNALQAYLAALSEDQLTRPTDDAGWTVKDHVIHLAVWEQAALAMLEGNSKRETLDIAPDIWDQDDDPINAVLQQRYAAMPLVDVMQTLQQNHERMMQKLNTLSDDDFQRPYRHYQPDSTSDRPIIDYIHWDTVNHYRDHLKWITAIVNRA